MKSDNRLKECESLVKDFDVFLFLLLIASKVSEFNLPRQCIEVFRKMIFWSPSLNHLTFNDLEGCVSIDSIINGFSAAAFVVDEKTFIVHCLSQSLHLLLDHLESVHFVLREKLNEC